MVGGADWASNWGAGEAPRVCVSEVMLRRVARAGDGVRAAGRAGEGGVGTTAREPAGWCAATLTTYTLVAYTIFFPQMSATSFWVSVSAPHFVRAAQRAASRDFQNSLSPAGLGTGKRYVGAGAGRRPGKARPGSMVWQPCGI